MMAVTAQALHEEDSSDVDESSCQDDANKHEEDQAALLIGDNYEHQDFSAASASSPPSPLSNSSASSSSLPPLLESELHHLLHLQKRISQTYPLSYEALLMLSIASKSLLNLNTACTSSLLTPLQNQLEYLQKVIPQPTHQDGRSASSCVISDALDYLEKLRRKIQSIKANMQESSNLSGDSLQVKLFQLDDCSPCIVDHKERFKVVHPKGSKLHIHVHYTKRKGLFSSVIFALETLGLEIVHMDASCNNLLVVNTIIAQLAGLCANN